MISKFELEISTTFFSGKTLEGKVESIQNLIELAVILHVRPNRELDLL